MRRAAAGTDGEGFALDEQLIRRHLHAVLLGKIQQNFFKPNFIRPLEGDRQAEPGRKAHQLLPGVGFVDVVAGAVGEGLFNKVAAVGGGVHRDVLCPAAHAALEDGFERGKVVVVGRKAQVVNEQNELEWVLGQAIQQGRNLIQLVLFHFHKAQTIRRKFIGNGFHAAGFAGARIAVQQNVHGRLAGQQSLGVGNYLFALVLVTGQLA